MPTNTGNIDNQPATSQSSQKNPLIIEMGSGRGTTGRCHTCLRKNIEICTAGQSSLSACRPAVGRRRRLCVWTTSVFLVERAGMRGKAKTKVRAARGQPAADECLRLTWCTWIWPRPSRGGDGRARSRRWLSRSTCAAPTYLALKLLRNSLARRSLPC